MTPAAAIPPPSSSTRRARPAFRTQKQSKNHRGVAVPGECVQAWARTSHPQVVRETFPAASRIWQGDGLVDRRLAGPPKRSFLFIHVGSSRFRPPQFGLFFVVQFARPLAPQDDLPDEKPHQGEDARKQRMDGVDGHRVLAFQVVACPVVRNPAGPLVEYRRTPLGRLRLSRRPARTVSRRRVSQDRGTRRLRRHGW